MDNKPKLQKLFTENQFQWFIVLCCQCVFLGFVCSRALTSIGMIGLLSTSLLYGGIKDSFKKYFSTKEMFVLSLFFWIVFFSGIYSDDKTNWLNWVRIKIPFIALPLAFASLRKIEEKKIVAILYGFILIFAFTTVIILINYCRHYQQITDSFSRGQAIPMPFSHIRYTLMLAFSFFCIAYLLSEKAWLFNKNERWVLIALGAFAFIALHVLAVRSGLLALYLGLFYIAAKVVIEQRKFWLGAAILIMIFILPLIAYQLFPALQNKLNYMRYDLERYNSGETGEYSDALRIISMKVGLSVWGGNVLLGVGAGDLKTETDKQYQQDYPQINESIRRLPHNQFIWVLATTGIIGLSLFFVAFFLPLFTNGYYKYWLLAVLHIMVFSSFFTEDTFEEQMGTGFYLIFLLILMNRFKRE